MPSAETRKILDDLRKAGLDLSSIDKQLETNPFVDKKADSILGGGILRQEEFTRITNQFKRDNGNLQAQVDKLAALHDNVESFIGEDKVYQAALETIAEMEDIMIVAGHNPEEVKALSYASKSGLSTAINKEKELDKTIDPKVVKKEGDDEMTLDTSKFVDMETYQRSMAQIGTGAVLVADKLNDFKTEARTLGIIITPEMNAKLHERVQKEFLTGQNSIDNIADQVLGISAKQVEVKEANTQKLIQEAEARGEAKGRTETEKEYGGAPRRQVGRVESPIYSRMQRQSETIVMPVKSGLVPNAEGKIEVPLNAKGEPELFKLRGDRGTRVGRASGLFNNPEAMKELAMQD